MKVKEIYKFVEGSNTWFYTSADTEETYLGDTYIPIPIGRTETESKNELSRANIEISLSIFSELGQRYMTTVVDAQVSLTIWSKWDAEYLVTWKGRLAAIKPQNAQIKLVFESIFTSLRRPGLRRRFQYNCGHVLYGRGCRLDKASFVFPADATAVSPNGVFVTVPDASSAEAGYFIGGIMQTPDGTLRFIVGHDGETIKLIRGVDSLTKAILTDGTQGILLFPGCDRTMNICKNRFNNSDNNGSFAYIPTRNPFSGSSIA